MEFENPAQKACYEKVAGFMKELFGEFAQAREDAPVFSVLMGSAWAQIVVLPWGNDDATIATRAYVVRGAELVPDLPGGDQADDRPAHGEARRVTGNDRSVIRGRRFRRR